MKSCCAAASQVARSCRCRLCSRPAAAGREGDLDRCAAVKKTMPKSLTFSNWPLYIDINEKTKSHPSLVAFDKQYGVNVKYLEDINDNDSFFGKIEGPLSQGQSINRDVIVLTDNSGLPGRMIELGWLEKLDSSALPNIKNLLPSLAHPDGTQPGVQPAVAVRHDRDRLRPEARRRRHQLGRGAVHRPEAEGEGDLADEMADTMGLVMAANGDDPSHVTDATFDKAATRSRRRSARARSASSPATTTPACSRRATSTHASPGRATWCSCRSTIRPQVGHPEHGRDDLDRQDADPEGRRRLRGVGADELRTTSRRSPPRSRTTSTTSARWSAPTRCC